MCDLNWCPVCEKSISIKSDSLYCSMVCFQKDALRPLDQNFTPFLVPKLCSLTNNNSPQPSNKEDDLPELANSIYTNSSTTSSSIFTRRAAFLSTTKHLQEEGYCSDEEEEIACCDYCENFDKKANGFIPTSIKVQKPYYVSLPLLLLPNTSTTTVSTIHMKNY